jgi:hypothetical protein
MKSKMSTIQIMASFASAFSRVSLGSIMSGYTGNVMARGNKCPVNPAGAKTLRRFYKAKYQRRGTYAEAREAYAMLEQTPFLAGSKAEKYAVMHPVWAE